MKCFYHAQADAVGTCKNCYKGVCRECAADLGDGLACKGRCEPAVEACNTMIRRNVRSSERSWIAFALLGLLIIAYGLAEVQRGSAIGVGSLVFGGIFVVLSAMNVLAGRKRGMT